MVKRGVVLLSGFAVAAVCACVFASPCLGHVASVSPSLRTKFEAIDAPVEKASATWTSALGALPSSPSSSALDKALSKVSPAYDAALKTFDKALAGLNLPGSAGMDATAIVKEDQVFESLLGSVSNISTSDFETKFKAIFAQDQSLASEFKSAMGLEADASMVI